MGVRSSALPSTGSVFKGFCSGEEEGVEHSDKMSALGHDLVD